MDTIFHPWIFSWAGKDCLHGYGYGFDIVQPDPNPTHCHPYQEVRHAAMRGFVHHVEAPNGKGPCDGDGLESRSRLVALGLEVLAALALEDQLLGVL